MPTGQSQGVSVTDSLECTVKESTPKPGHLCDKHKATQGARQNVHGSTPNATPPGLHPLDRLSEQQPSLAEFPKSQAANKALFPMYICKAKKHSWGGAYIPYLDSGPIWTCLDRKTHPKPTSSWHRRVKPSKPCSGVRGQPLAAQLHPQPFQYSGTCLGSHCFHGRQY